VAVGAVSQVSDVIDQFHKLLAREEVTEQELQQQLGFMKEGNDLAMANLRRAADLVQSFNRTAVDQTSEQRREFQLSEVLSDVVYSLRPLFKHSRGTCRIRQASRINRNLRQKKMQAPPKRLEDQGIES
jgi:hypothetical protein